MRSQEKESKITQKILTIVVIGSILLLSSCTPTGAESQLETPILNTQVTTCIYNSNLPPLPNEPVCHLDSPALSNVGVVLFDNQGTPHQYRTNVNGQIIADPKNGLAFFSNTEYPSWNIDYTQSVGGYCFAYPAIVEDSTNPTWIEFQYAYLPCTTK